MDPAKAKEDYLALQKVEEVCSIKCLPKVGKLIDIASVNIGKARQAKKDGDVGAKIESVTVTLPPKLRSLAGYTRELCGHMVDLSIDLHAPEEIRRTTTHDLGNRQYIRGTLFSSLRFRRAIYFYVLQESEKGMRILLYTFDIVRHNGGSFGTGVQEPDVIREIQPPIMREKLMDAMENARRYDILHLYDRVVDRFTNFVNDNESYFL